MDLVDALRLELRPGEPDVVALVGGGGKSSAAFQLAAEAAARSRRAVVTTTTHMGADEALDAPALVEVAEEGGDLPDDRLAQALEQHGWCLLAGPLQGEKRSGLAPAQVERLAAQAGRLNLALTVVEADGSRKLPIKAPAAHEPVIPATTTLLVPVVGVDAIGRTVAAGQVHRPEQLRALLALPPGAEARLTPAQVARLLLHPDGGDKDRPPGARRVALVNKVERPEQVAMAHLVAAHCAAAGVPSIIAALGRTGAPPVLERWAPLAVVVLAAGQASRMGRAKQLLAVDGVTMVRRAVQTALASGAQQLVLVTGAYAEEVALEAKPLAAAHAHLTLIDNDAWATGQASSMHVGLAALDPTIEAVTFLPVDQPYVPHALLRRMVRRWQAGAAIVAPTVGGELRGAPALFDRALWPELLEVTGDVGGRSVLRRHADSVQTLAVEADWLRDVDTPADLSVESPYQG
jgi:molybdenum cofactor cytidylyltransferase